MNSNPSSKPKKSKTLPPRIKYFFDQFCLVANKRSLHPSDLRRFNTFITACHLGHSKLSDHELIGILEKEGFDWEEALYLADLYNRGRDLVKESHKKAVLLWKYKDFVIRHLYGNTF